MRGLLTCALAAILVASTLGTISAGQTGASGPIQYVLAAAMSNGGLVPQWQDGRFPSGDYQQTCRDIRNNGNRLEATCQNRNGDWRSTSLDYRDCNGSIVNDDGRLSCSNNGGDDNRRRDGDDDRSRGGNDDRWRDRVPPGNYQQTCRDIRIDGNRLNATCQKRSGSWRNTSLNNFNHCRTEIENDNGHLRCR